MVTNYCYLHIEKVCYGIFITDIGETIRWILCTRQLQPRVLDRSIAFTKIYKLESYLTQ